MQSSKLVVASISCPELGTAQPQLVLWLFPGPPTPCWENFPSFTLRLKFDKNFRIFPYNSIFLYINWSFCWEITKKHQFSNFNFYVLSDKEQLQMLLLCYVVFFSSVTSIMVTPTTYKTSKGLFSSFTQPRDSTNKKSNLNLFHRNLPLSSPLEEIQELIFSSC